MFISPAVPAALAGLLMAVLVGCSTTADDGAADSVGTSDNRAAVSVTPTPEDPAPPKASLIIGAAPATTSAASDPEPRASDQRTETATLAIPAIGLQSLRVVPYEGTTDDWPGTLIQNRGLGASPYGKDGGVGPGEVGNYLVTAHRLSAGGPLRDLPALDEGDTVRVTVGGEVYVYEITETRQTSFRSERSLAEQRAAVPGHPGEQPTKAMITISTCATPEDNAAGNYWRDDRGNPEHRIDKIGVLRS
ncbi:class E sortase [Streptomyces sp. NPDC051907]|uniref:class E sortase n=1 Tax=Streptomyces sp. NPDC051907 TaxID=3155284 RepID=UPI00344823F8